MAEFDALVARIRSEFPGLAFDRTRLNEEGADHRLVFLDERWAFRFPRTPERAALFQAELQILGALRGASIPPIPDYAFISAGRDFGGYALIAGEPLRPATFRQLDDAAQERVLGEIASLLTAVHALPVSAITPPGGEPAHEWAPADWTRRYDAERGAEIAKGAPAGLLPAIARFYRAFAERPVSEREVVIHGDLSDDHMLIAPAADRLAGVIDFGDVCLGDPAYDFSYFYAYGEAAARHLADLYDPNRSDSTLLERARWSYARYRIEQLRWSAMGVITDQREEIVGDLPGLFDQLGL